MPPARSCEIVSCVKIIFASCASQTAQLRPGLGRERLGGARRARAASAGRISPPPSAAAAAAAAAAFSRRLTMLWAIQILVGKLTGASTLLTRTNSAKVRAPGEVHVAAEFGDAVVPRRQEGCSRAPARSTAALPAAVCTKRTVGWKRQHTSHVAGNPRRPRSPGVRREGAAPLARVDFVGVVALFAVGRLVPRQLRSERRRRHGEHHHRRRRRELVANARRESELTHAAATSVEATLDHASGRRRAAPARGAVAPAWRRCGCCAACCPRGAAAATDCWRPTLDDVERISWGKAAKQRGTGGRAACRTG